MFYILLISYGTFLTIEDMKIINGLIDIKDIKIRFVDFKDIDMEDVKIKVIGVKDINKIRERYENKFYLYEKLYGKE